MKISQKIIDYAIWYYLKYYPSIFKLKQKIVQKFGKNSPNWEKYGWIESEEIEYIIKESLRNIINEKEVLKAKIKNFVDRWKNKNYIKSNLLQKGFIKDEIDEIFVQNFDTDNNTILDKFIVKKKILNLKSKGKTRNYIRQKFIENSFDKEMIEDILDEIFLEIDEEAILLIEIELICKKLNISNLAELDYKIRQKYISKLLSKWFSYSSIIWIIWK